MTIADKTSADIVLFAPSGPPPEGPARSGLEIVTQEAPQVFSMLSEFSAKSASDSPFPWLAGSDEFQTRRFFRLFRASSVKMLWAVRGGYGILRWLDRVDWDSLVSENAPLVAGFSDVTCLHAALNRIGVKTLHAPMLCTLENTDAPSRKALWDFFLKGTLPELSGERIVADGGTVTGRLAGGNLATLCHLVGTPWEPVWKDSILVLEDVNEPIYRIDRMLSHLLQSGRLKSVNAIVLGEFSCTGAEDGELDALFEDRLGGLGVPVAAGFPVGHGSRNMPLMLGGIYELEAGILRLLGSSLSD